LDYPEEFFAKSSAVDEAEEDKHPQMVGAVELERTGRGFVFQKFPRRKERQN
jgi:hypothetical protein